MSDLPWPLSILAMLADAPYLVGFIVAFLLTVIPGPMNAIVIEQTMKKGPVAGMRISIGNTLGQATAVFITCLPFLFGADFIAHWLEANMFWAMLGTTLMLLVIGLLMFFAKDNEQKQKKPDMGYPLWAYFYTSIYPGNLLTFTAIVAAMQLGGTITTMMDVWFLLGGFLTGASLGWAAYLLVLIKTRKKLTPKVLVIMRKTLAGLVVALSLLMLIPIFS